MHAQDLRAPAWRLEHDPFGKLVLVIVMFIGRVGIISFLWLVRGRAVKDSYHYPKERVIIG